MIVKQIYIIVFCILVAVFVWAVSKTNPRQIAFPPAQEEVKVGDDLTAEYEWVFGGDMVIQIDTVFTGNAQFDLPFAGDTLRVECPRPPAVIMINGEAFNPPDDSVFVYLMSKNLPPMDCIQIVNYKADSLFVRFGWTEDSTKTIDTRESP